MSGKWYRGNPEAAERFMARWHENEAHMSNQRPASSGAPEGMRGRGGNRRSGRKPDQGNAGKGGQQEEWREEVWRETRPRECGEGGATGGVEGKPWEGDSRQGSSAPGRLVSRTCPCYSCPQLLKLVRTWSSIVFLLFSCMTLRDFLIVILRKQTILMKIVLRLARMTSLLCLFRVV